MYWFEVKKYKVEIKSHWQAKEFLHSIDFLPIHHYEIHTLIEEGNSVIGRIDLVLKYKFKGISTGKWKNAII